MRDRVRHSDPERVTGPDALAASSGISRTHDGHRERALPPKHHAHMPIRSENMS